MELTTHELWDEMWAAIELPVEVDVADPYPGSIVAKMESYLPRSASTIMELGGAPGGYLAHFAGLGLSPFALEISEIGCEKTRQSWRMLGIDGTVIRGDMFHANRDRYDIVYSLGLIEHFDDLTYVIRHHVKFLKPGGTLIVGCPNFRGVYRGLLHRLAPERLSGHNLATMNVESWDGFESTLGLQRLFRGYVGGFEPRLFMPLERSGVAARVFARSAGLGSRALRLPLARETHRLNHPAISCYMLGIYRCGSVEVAEAR